MENYQSKSPSIVDEVVKKIVAMAAPSKIILYNCKYDVNEMVETFKLCIVGEVEDKRLLLLQIYQEIESDIPFDILIYTDRQFDDLLKSDESFVSRISKRGKVLYEES